MAASHGRQYAPAAFGAFALVAFIITYVVGFFATAGAAGVDFGTNSRDDNDVNMGGFLGVVVAIIFTAGFATLIVAGAYGNKEIVAKLSAEGKVPNSAFDLIPIVLGAAAGKWAHVPVGPGGLPAGVLLSLHRGEQFQDHPAQGEPLYLGRHRHSRQCHPGHHQLVAGLIAVFAIIGASFGPVCGAMLVDYLMNGSKWAGPRRGFNPAGWMAWGFGFVVGIMPNIGLPLPLAPVWAMFAGAIIYYLAAKAGLQPPAIPLSGPLAEATK